MNLGIASMVSERDNPWAPYMSDDRSPRPAKVASSALCSPLGFTQHNLLFFLSSLSHNLVPLSSQALNARDTILLIVSFPAAIACGATELPHATNVLMGAAAQRIIQVQYAPL